MSGYYQKSLLPFGIGTRDLREDCTALCSCPKHYAGGNSLCSRSPPLTAWTWHPMFLDQPLQKNKTEKSDSTIGQESKMLARTSNTTESDITKRDRYVQTLNKMPFFLTQK